MEQHSRQLKTTTAITVKTVPQWFASLLAVAVTIALATAAIVIDMQLRAQHRVSTDPHDLQPADCAVVLGCAPTVRGRPNLYYVHRLNQAADLYHSGLIKHILVSGDNRHHGYNEPDHMFTDLLNRGVPANAITKDFAGFRTLDSVIRAKQVFGLDSIIIVSQSFHVARALFIADQQNIQAQGLIARSPNTIYHNKLLFREIAARLMAWGDCLLWHRQPHFPGPYEPIEFLPQLSQDHGEEVEVEGEVKVDGVEQGDDIS